jgi:outer membrane protein assembly factor BamB
MISSLSISFENKTITIHSVYNGDEIISNQPEKDSDGQICYLEMRENGRKIWAKTFSTDILEAATCVCAYSPTRKQVLLGYGLKIYAIDESTGKLEWLTEMETPVHAIFLDDFDNIFIQNELSIVKLDSNGSKQWEYSHCDIISQVTLNTTEILISDITQAEYRPDIANGNLLSY